MPTRRVGTAEKVERGWGWWAGYPGRQSLHSFALGYSLVVLTGRQMEPPNLGYYIYRQNGGADGQHFLQRYLAVG